MRRADRALTARALPPSNSPTGAEAPRSAAHAGCSAVQARAEAEIPDARLALRAATAWNKLLLVHLNVLLPGYMLPARSAPG